MNQYADKGERGAGTRRGRSCGRSAPRQLPESTALGRAETGRCSPPSPIPSSARFLGAQSFQAARSFAVVCTFVNSALKEKKRAVMIVVFVCSCHRNPQSEVSSVAPSAAAPGQRLSVTGRLGFTKKHRIKLTLPLSLLSHHTHVHMKGSAPRDRAHSLHLHHLLGGAGRSVHRSQRCQAESLPFAGRSGRDILSLQSTSKL